MLRVMYCGLRFLGVVCLLCCLCSCGYSVYWLALIGCLLLSLVLCFAVCFFGRCVVWLGCVYCDCDYLCCVGLLLLVGLVVLFTCVLVYLLGELVAGLLLFWLRWLMFDLNTASFGFIWCFRMLLVCLISLIAICW